MPLRPKFTPLDDRLYAYLLAHRSPDDEVVRELREETARLGGHAVMQISPDQATFLRILVASIGASRAVEVGTFTGFSALAIARGLPPDGRLLCLDVSEEWTAIARRAWAKAGVADRIELRLGPAVETLRALPESPRSTSPSSTRTRRAIPSTGTSRPPPAPGGVVAVDNVLWEGEVVQADKHGEDVEAIRAVQRKGPGRHTGRVGHAGRGRRAHPGPQAPVAQAPGAAAPLLSSPRTLPAFMVDPRPPADPVLDIRVRWRAGKVLLGLAGALTLVALVAAARPLVARLAEGGDALLLGLGVTAAALLASLRGRKMPETLALQAFLVSRVDALGQVIGARGFPVWPLMTLLVASLAVAEGLPVALAVAGQAALLALADALRPLFPPLPPAGRRRSTGRRPSPPRSGTSPSPSPSTVRSRARSAGSARRSPSWPGSSTGSSSSTRSPPAPLRRRRARPRPCGR